MTIKQIAITDRDQWLKLRGVDVTASVAGCLLGVHPYITAYGLYLLKSGLITEDAEETPILRRGRLLEPVAVQMLREDRPKWSIETYPVGLYYRDPDWRLGATPDVLARDENGKKIVIQVKTVEPSIFRKNWKGEGGEIEPPIWVTIQGIIEAHLTGADEAYVAPMVVGFGLEMPTVRIPIHAGIITRIKGEIAKFWKRVEDKDPPPQDYSRDGALIANLYPVDNGTTIDLSQSNRFMELLDNRESLKMAISTAENGCKEVEAEIKAMIGEASAASAADGRKATFNVVNRKEYVAPATSYRQLRVTKPKISKVA